MAVLLRNDGAHIQNSKKLRSVKPLPLASERAIGLVLISFSSPFDVTRELYRSSHTYFLMKIVFWSSCHHHSYQMRDRHLHSASLKTCVILVIKH